MKGTRMPRAAEGGFALITVLGICVLILIVGTTTLWILRQNLNRAGGQVKDFQSLHAAEAGIAYLQHRLNGLVMCQAWMTRADSLAVLALMRDTTIVLPNVYGAARGFKIRKARVDPLARPFRIRFESVGGRLLPGGKVDTAKGTVVVSDLRMRTMADFALFDDLGDINTGAGATMVGRVHAGRDLNTGDSAIFHKEATYGRNLNLGAVPGSVSFRQGHKRVAANPLTLNHIRVSLAAPGNPCNGAMPRSYEELARGLIAGEGRGFHHSNFNRRVLLILDSLRVVGSDVRLKLYVFDPALPGFRGAMIKNESMPRSLFNGVVFVDADIYIRGTLTNTSLTLVSTDDVLAVDNVICLGNEAGGDGRVTMGIIAQDMRALWENCPTYIKLEATSIGLARPLVLHGIHDPNGLGMSMLGTNLTHPGRDANGNPASNAAGPNWRAIISGGQITRGGTSGPWFAMGERIYEFDADNLYSPPPKFPMLRAAMPGVSRWESVGWR